MKAFKALCERATERPWHWEFRATGNVRTPIAITGPNADALVGTGDGEEAWLDVSDANARLLTIGANHVEELVAEVASALWETHHHSCTVGTPDTCKNHYCARRRELLAKIEEAAEGRINHER